ncbi:cation transporter [Candidatus Colwellia aromaticivorans]|uniref:cation transporter n=1 Tax=Candidatus Colwellia aromaticivorans TaxID=2267621 RepID=UPI000DF29AAE|nr:cation transporter [Candidatus Colwellia aromaticivorans]
MTKFDHRVGVKEANLVVRNLRLTNVTDANRELLMEDIDNLFGIDEASFNTSEATIYLVYDATNINLEGIEEIIKKHGADIHNDWWTHTKDEYYKFVDQNVKDNAKHVPWSCHKPPSGAGKKHN